MGYIVGMGRARGPAGFEGVTMGARKVGDVVCGATGHAVAVWWNPETEEYRAGQGAAAYFTESYRDAIRTAAAINRGMGGTAPRFIGRPHRPAPGHE